MFYCHCCVLWVGRAMPVGHIAAFLWMFSQPAFNVHKTLAFSRMTVFILLSYRKKIHQLHFWRKQEQTTGLIPCGQRHQIAPHRFRAHSGGSNAQTPFSRPQSLPGPFIQHHYYQEPLTSTNNPINLLFMARQKPNYMIKFCQKLKPTHLL